MPDYGGIPPTPYIFSFLYTLNLYLVKMQTNTTDRPFWLDNSNQNTAAGQQKNHSETLRKAGMIVTYKGEEKIFF